jgi:hypothetical protein
MTQNTSMPHHDQQCLITSFQEKFPVTIIAKDLI